MVTIVCCLGDRLGKLAFHDIVLMYKDKLMLALLLAVCIHTQKCRIHLIGWISSNTENFCQWPDWIFPELERHRPFLQRSVERFDRQLLTCARMNIHFRLKGRAAQWLNYTRSLRFPFLVHVPNWRSVSLMFYTRTTSTLEEFLSQKDAKFNHGNSFLLRVTYFVAF